MQLKFDLNLGNFRVGGYDSDQATDAEGQVNLSAEQVSRATGSNLLAAASWAPYLNDAMTRFEINTPQRQAAFLAQIGHETGGLNRFGENLNYSAAGLLKTFKKYFKTAEMAERYQRQPERIANLVYANRMGNGDEASGDGWRYRGKGPIQLTGKDNHRLCGQALGYDLVTNPDLLLEPEVGSLAAGWFWSQNKLNADADRGDIKAISKLINAGNRKVRDEDVHGLGNRIALYNKGIAELAA